MNSNNIEITQILGTDSLSSSRIVINDNFKILANSLNNYKNFFDENGVYSSKIISKDVNGTIEFLPDASSTTPMMRLSQTKGIAINLPLEVGGSSKFSKISVNELTKNNSNKITISSDVEIQGNLSVSGSSPSGGGGSSETILMQNFSDFLKNSQLGYEQAYNKGRCIMIDNEKIPLENIIQLSKNMNVKQIAQYIHKPFVFTGSGICISLKNEADIKRVTTNGIIRDNILVPTNPGNITTIKVYPAIFKDNIMFDIQFSTTLR